MNTLIRIVFLGAIAATMGGCSIADLVNGNQLPTGLNDPNIAKNREGALKSYNSALHWLLVGIGTGSSSYIPISAVLTDELQYLPSTITPYPNNAKALIDVRLLDDNDNSVSGRRMSEDLGVVYSSLHSIRMTTREGIGALGKYGEGRYPALIGHLYSIEAFAQILLAELYCSGIPLTRLNYEHSFTPTRGYSSEEVYKHSLKLLDTALKYSADSTRFVNLAKVLMVRALMNLGEYDSASTIANKIPPDYVYSVRYSNGSPSFIRQMHLEASGGVAVTMGNVKGLNGLPYLGSGDVRTAGAAISPRVSLPSRYSATGTTPVVIASGVEAVLASAENYLKKNDVSGWLKAINSLRTDGTFSTIVRPDNSGIDTTWNEGYGASLYRSQASTVGGMAPLADPGSDTARVSLQFAEKAFWLYLTGHRQGDMRRLVRQYQREEDVVYPTGIAEKWMTQIVVEYGYHVNLPVPIGEQETNPLYKGCIDRDA